MEQSSSDPLPYTQVDRAVKPKATLLAGAVGVSPQHALGSLIEFWDLNGDPREIEKLLLAGKDEVLLTRQEALDRFEVACGKPLAPERLALIGILEQRGELFRVRGMSRYFAPVRTRLMAREKGRAGGLASAKVRAEKYGTAQPRPIQTHRPEPEILLDLGMNAAQAGDEGSPKPPRSSAEADVEAFGKQAPNPPEPAVSGQRSSSLKAAAAGDDVAGSFAAWVNDARLEKGVAIERPVADLNLRLAPVLLELNGDIERLKLGYLEYLHNETRYWAKEKPPHPLRGFLSQALDFCPARAPPPGPVSVCAVCGAMEDYLLSAQQHLVCANHAEEWLAWPKGDDWEAAADAFVASGRGASP